MLDEARATVASAAALSELPGNGKASQDEAQEAGPSLIADAGKVTIKLH